MNPRVKKSNSRSELYRPSYVNGEEGAFDVKPFLDKGVFKVR